MVSHTPCSILFYSLSMPSPLNHIVLHRATQAECKDTVVLYVPCLQTYVCSCVHFVKKKKKSNMFVSLSSAFHLTAPLFMLQHIAKFCSAEGWMKGQPVWCVVTMHHTTLNDARHCACAIWSITHAGWAPYIVENTTSGVGTCKGVQNT